MLQTNNFPADGPLCQKVFTINFSADFKAFPIAESVCWDVPNKIGSFCRNVSIISRDSVNETNRS